jgi:hypothetical protein
MCMKQLIFIKSFFAATSSNEGKGSHVASR